MTVRQCGMQLYLFMNYFFFLPCCISFLCEYLGGACRSWQQATEGVQRKNRALRPGWAAPETSLQILLKYNIQENRLQLLFPEEKATATKYEHANQVTKKK